MIMTALDVSILKTQFIKKIIFSVQKSERCVCREAGEDVRQPDGWRQDHDEAVPWVRIPQLPRSHLQKEADMMRPKIVFVESPKYCNKKDAIILNNVPVK